MNDILGREIEVGSVIAYSVKESTSVETHIAVVRKVQDGKIKVTTFQGDHTYETTLHSTRTLVVLPTYSEIDLIAWINGPEEVGQKKLFSFHGITEAGLQFITGIIPAYDEVQAILTLHRRLSELFSDYHNFTVEVEQIANV